MHDTEKEMRRALFGRKAAPATLCNTIRSVIVNCRPRDGVGLNEILEVPVNTISRFEADLEAMAEVRRLGLRSPVVIRYEYHDRDTGN